MRTSFFLLSLIFCDTSISAVTNITSRCDKIIAYNSKNIDSSAILQECINKTPIGQTLSLPKGKYTLTKEVVIKRSIKLTTLGISSAPCSLSDAHECAELKASAETLTKVGFFKVLANNVTIDHIVINGNKQNRYQSSAAAMCKTNANNNIYGQNTKFVGNNIVITKSVFKNALCGTSLYLISGSGFQVTNNKIDSNGVHDQELLWSDGLTALEISNSNISNNFFSNNTDVDLVIGGCPNCTIKSNRIIHSNSFSTSSFAGIMIQAWPNGGTSGNYTNSDISKNYINCSTNQRCGFGLYVGSSAWYNADTYGGNVHDNKIVGAQQGFAVDKVRNFSIANNQVLSSQGTFQTSCGPKYFSAFVITPGTQVNRSDDLIADNHYLSFKLDNCIPNDWKHPYYKAGTLNLSSGKNITIQSVKFNIQEDGNLVIYKSGSPIRASNTFADCSNSKCNLIFQGDGNLVFYNSRGIPLWDSGTYGHENSRIEFSDTAPYIRIIDSSGNLLFAVN